MYHTSRIAKLVRWLHIQVTYSEFALSVLLLLLTVIQPAEDHPPYPPVHIIHTQCKHACYIIIMNNSLQHNCLIN